MRPPVKGLTKTHTTASDSGREKYIFFSSEKTYKTACHHKAYNKKHKTAEGYGKCRYKGGTVGGAPLALPRVFYLFHITISFCDLNGFSFKKIKVGCRQFARFFKPIFPYYFCPAKAKRYIILSHKA